MGILNSTSSCRRIQIPKCILLSVRCSGGCILNNASTSSSPKGWKQEAAKLLKTTANNKEVGSRNNFRWGIYQNCPSREMPTQYINHFSCVGLRSRGKACVEQEVIY